RRLANRGHFPAIEVLQSISRVRPEVTNSEQQKMANRIGQLLAAFAELEDLVNIGAFTQGANPVNDLAVRMNGKIMEFLKQSTTMPVSLEQARAQLTELYAAVEREAKVIEQQQRQNVVAGNAGRKK
ncbi:MAG TPA: EscN/YscN/HrcN family type III secretion system ATPase, partial [Phycisphaerae bacterium]